MTDAAPIERIRELLRRGYGPDKVVREITGRVHDPLHTVVVVEKTKLDGTWKTVDATAEAEADARNNRRPMPRWKELAAMMYGEADSASVDSVRVLFEEHCGPGSARGSWTGRGRKPSAYSDG